MAVVSGCQPASSQDAPAGVDGGANFEVAPSEELDGDPMGQGIVADAGGESNGPEDNIDETGPEVRASPDTILVDAGAGDMSFVGATGRWRADIAGTILGGARVVGAGAESLAVRFDGAGVGEYNCGRDALLSYNARYDGGEPRLWSTRHLGASCSITVTEYGEVGGRLRGVFSGVLLEEAGSTLAMSGSFDVQRLDDL
jgi:hypothetical protein